MAKNLFLKKGDYEEADEIGEAETLGSEDSDTGEEMEVEQEKRSKKNPALAALKKAGKKRTEKAPALASTQKKTKVARAPKEPISPLQGREPHHVWTNTESALLVLLHNGCTPIRTESTLAATMSRETGTPFTATQIKSKLNTIGVANKLIKDSPPVERGKAKAPVLPLALTPVEIRVQEFERPIKIISDDEKILLVWRNITGRTVSIDINTQNKIVFTCTVDALSDDEVKDLIQTNCSAGAGIDGLSRLADTESQTFYLDMPPEAVVDGKWWDLVDPTERFFGVILQRKVTRERMTVLRSEKTKSREGAAQEERMRKLAIGLDLQTARDKEELFYRLMKEMHPELLNNSSKPEDSKAQEM